MSDTPHEHPLIALQRLADEQRRAAQQSSRQSMSPSSPPNPFASTTPIGEADDTRRAAWVDSMLRRAAERLSCATEGTRNGELNVVSYTLGGIVHLGLDERTARDTLASIALQIGLTPSETASTLRSGFEAGKSKPMSVELAERELLNGAVEPIDDMPDFWKRRELLQHIFDSARARRVSPWAVLGVVLAHAVAAMPQTLVLPPLIGGYGSLNIFIGLVGVSGVGKGGAERAAADAVTLPYVAHATVGSGEGLVHSYVRRTREGIEQHTHQMIFSVPEVDTLSAVGARLGSTLLPELRRAWSGEALGFAYADPAKRLRVEPHAYRLAMIVGIQPARAGKLLNDVDGGTPQRFVWLPAVDRLAPDAVPPPPQRIAPKLPDLRDAVHDTARHSPFGGLLVMGVCDQARQIIDDAARARLRSELDALDGHALFCQLKVAAALALLDGRLDVDDDDWQLADTIMIVSRRTRESVAQALSDAARATNDRRADDYAARTFRVADRAAERDADHEERAQQRIVTLLDGGVLLPRNDLRRGVRQNYRHAFDDALAALLSDGKIIEHVDEKGVTRYALVP